MQSANSRVVLKPLTGQAVTRDIKNYISKNAKRAIPVGYSAADVREVLFDTWNYLHCTTTSNEQDPSRVDFFALNSYSWCGDSDFDKSTYAQLVAGLDTSSFPVFFSEYGCNEVHPRIFQEVPTIYGPAMTDVFSGGVMYEYTQEQNNYGIVNLYSNGSADLRADYIALQSQYNELDLAALQSARPRNDKVNVKSCSSALITTSGFAKDFKLPETPADAQDMIDSGLEDANRGRMVALTNTRVVHPVYDADGNEIRDLAITVLPDSQSNLPSGQQTKGGSGSGDGNSDGTNGSGKDRDSGVARVASSVCALVLVLALGIIMG